MTVKGAFEPRPCGRRNVGRQERWPNEYVCLVSGSWFWRRRRRRRK